MGSHRLSIREDEQFMRSYCCHPRPLRARHGLSHFRLTARPSEAIYDRLFRPQTRPAKRPAKRPATPGTPGSSWLGLLGFFYYVAEADRQHPPLLPETGTRRYLRGRLQWSVESVFVPSVQPSLGLGAPGIGPAVTRLFRRPDDEDKNESRSTRQGISPDEPLVVRVRFRDPRGSEKQ